MIDKKAASALAIAFWAALAVASTWNPGFGGEPLTNAAIAKAIASGTPSLLVIANINTSPTNFDVSESALTSLRQNGIPEEVIAAMTAAHVRASAAPIPLPQPGLGRVPSIRDTSTALQPIAPAPTASPMPSPMPPPEPAPEARFNSELANIANGAPETRKTALAWMLANRAQALPLLRKALADSRPETQAAALQALGSLQDTESRVQIRPLLASQSPQVRLSAAQVLAEMEDIEAIAASEKVLTQPLEPKDGYIRLVGAARLVRASGELAELLSESPSAQNRAAAAWALAEIGRAGSVAWPALENALLNDKDPSVRREAARAVAIYHDDSSARLLQTACRRDPEVRKIILRAMADYPETVGFLVDVMKLGTDQIAPDELETARTSLRRLTGEDYGLDGARWGQWFADNRSRFPAAGSTPPAVASFVSQGGISSASSDRIQAAVAETGEVDITSLGIIVDPNLIPMAPEVDDRSPSRFMVPGSSYGTAPSGGGALPLPPTGFGADSGAAPTDPMALSPTDFTDAPGLYGPSAPSAPAPAGAGSGGGSMFRTWSSAPAQDAPPATATAAPEPFDDFAGPSAPGGAAAPGETRLWSPNLGGNEAAATPSDDFGGLGGATASAPAAPIASPEPSMRSATPPVLSGISLPLPPMAGMSGTSDAPAVPDDTAAATDFDAAPASPFGSYTDESYAVPTFSDGFGQVVADTDDGTDDMQTLRPDDPSQISGSDDFGEEYEDGTFAGAAEGGDGDEGMVEEYSAGDLAPDDSFFEQPPAGSPGTDSGPPSLVQGMIMPPPPGSSGSAPAPDDSAVAGTALPVPFPTDSTGAETGAAREYHPSSAGIDYYTEITDVHVPQPANSPLFVAPEPGQVVLGDNLLGDGEDWEGYPEGGEWPTTTVTAPEGAADSIPDQSGAALPPPPAASPAASDATGDIAGDTAPEAADSGKTVLPPVTDTEEGLVSELWDGPEEFYQNLDDIEGTDYEIVGTGEAQETTFIGSEVDFSDLPEMPAMDSEQVDAMPALPALPESDGTPAAQPDGPPRLQIPALDSSTGTVQSDSDSGTTSSLGAGLIQSGR